MDFNKKVVKKESIITQEVDDEIVLLDTNSSNYFGLDNVSIDIWKGIEEGKNLNEIYNSILEKYEVKEEELKKDIESFIISLEVYGIISFDSK